MAKEGPKKDNLTIDGAREILGLGKPTLMNMTKILEIGGYNINYSLINSKFVNLSNARKLSIAAQILVAKYDQEEIVKNERLMNMYIKELVSLLNQTRDFIDRFETERHVYDSNMLAPIHSLFSKIDAIYLESIKCKKLVTDSHLRKRLDSIHDIIEHYKVLCDMYEQERGGLSNGS
ncbi:MAG: hypothetical protein WC755_06980 [Candidatus Woesearchaeota archaeon]|jgi:hypothetical protein